MANPSSTAHDSSTMLDADLHRAQARSSFAEHGYQLVKNLMKPDMLAGLTEDFDRVVAQITQGSENVNARWRSTENDKLDGGTSMVMHTHNVHLFSGRWARFLFDERLLDLAEAFLGAGVVLHHTKLFVKPPEIGASFPPHQDWTYFPMRRDRMIAAIVHLSPATDEMGCVRVWPGSHRLGRIADSRGYDAPFSERFPLSTSIPMEAQLGDVLFFHYLTVHASQPNRSAHTRKTVLIQLHAGDDELEDESGHPYARLMLRGWNPLMTRAKAGRQ